VELTILQNCSAIPGSTSWAVALDTSVAFRAESDQILFRVIARMTSRSDVMNFEARS
jgi:hypothetical protein